MNKSSTQSYTQPDNYDKGSAFEQFIIRLFNGRSFRLKEWRKARKITDSNFIHDLSNPDLEIELVFAGRRRYRFAVECKWRKEFIGDRITWATDLQIVTPLNNICEYTDVYERELIPYKRKPTRKFFYDFRQLKLF